MVNKLKSKWENITITYKVSISYTVCSILQKCLSFITLPLFTRLLTTEQYGQYTIYASWAGIICIFLTLNLAYGSFSKAMVKFENRREEYIASIQGICLLLSGIFLLLYLPFSKLWNNILELPTFMVILMVVEILTQTAIQLWNGKKRFEFKYKSVVAVTLFSSIAAPLAAYFLVLKTEERGYARIIGYAGTTIIVGGILFGLNMIKGKKLYNKNFWKYALGFNTPLLIYYLSQVVFNQSDRIMISHMTGKSDAAMYGVAYNLAMILTFVLNAINNSYIPWLYGKVKEGNGYENKRASTGIAILMALMLLCIIWYAPEIILVMAGDKYTDAIYVVAPVAMSLLLLFYSQLFINMEFYYEEKKMLIWASLGAAVLNILLNWILIPVFGFVAAGYTTFISYIVFAGSNCFAMKKVLAIRGKKDNLYDYKALNAILVLFVFSGFFGVVLYDWFIPRVLITVMVLCILIGFRKRLIENLHFVKTN